MYIRRQIEETSPEVQQYSRFCF